MIRRISCTLAVFLVPHAASAQTLASLDAVDAEVARFTGAQAGTPGGAAMPVDRRLRLRPCTQALTSAWYGAGQDMVEVRCPAPGGWRLFVPVVRSSAQQATAPAAITRGDAVTIAIIGSGFSVSQSGEAMESGAIGAWIKVRSSNPKAAALRGRVLRPGVVGIDLP